MAYIVSQIRKDVSAKYMQDLTVSASTVSSPNPFGSESQYIDLALTPSSSFTSNNVYYLRFRIHKIPQYYYSKYLNQINIYNDNVDTLSVRLLLLDSNKIEGDEYTPQEIGSFIVNKCSSEDNESQDENKKYSSFSFVFHPTKGFDKLVFRVNRITYDAIHPGTDSRQWLTEYLGQSDIDTEDERYDHSGTKITVKTQGPRIEYEGANGDFCILNNIVPDGQKWVKFGYQSRPGSLIVVNNQPIIVGRSGIYEIDNGTKVESFMITSPNGANNNNIDAFLLDYAYLSSD